MTPTHRHLSAALLACLCGVGLGHAQVLRCTDADGRVTYTNTGCPHSKQISEVVPHMTAQERSAQEAQYQQALARKRSAQQLQAERDAAQRQADAQRAALQANQRPAPTVVVQVPPPVVLPPVVSPSYGPLYPPHVRPPVRPVPPLPPPPNTQAPGYNCNVFRCYDGKGNTWNRP